MDSGHQPLKVVVCGYERGGTSLIAELLRQHPALDGGFEGGFLLGKKPRDFLSALPYRSNVKAGWGVTEEELRHICDTDSWQELYRRLREKATELTDKSVWLFDKTPKYMEVLPGVLRKIPHVPCIVVVRDPRAVLWSWAKRSGLEVETWRGEQLKPSCKRYVRYGEGWQSAIKAGFAPRIFLIRYEVFCEDPRRWAVEMFHFLGMEFDDSFLEFHPRFPNVYGHTPTGQYIDDYRRHFSDEVCERILALTKRFRDWHW
jgi:Sulfotransferase family